MELRTCAKVCSIFSTHGRFCLFRIFRRSELDVNSLKMPRVIHGIEIRMECLVYTWQAFTSPVPRLIHGVDLRRT